MKESWSKAFLQGSFDVVKGVGSLLFNPNISEPILNYEDKPWELSLTEVLNELLEECKENDDSSNVSRP